jgi:hypothetical protein
MSEPKSKQNDDGVLNYWIASADGFALPPQEFYLALEKELQGIQVPGLDIAREEFAEGGLLSEKRLYLQLMRERLTFYICAAPFGTRYFFSCRTVYVPPTVKFWHVMAVLAALCAIFYYLELLLGWLFAGVALIGLLIAIILSFRNVVAQGLQDVDALLLKIPAISPIYQRFFRKETYYRKDARNMYLDTVPSVVRALAEQVTAAKGVTLIRQYESAPILGELYKPVTPKPPEPDGKQ